MNVIIKARATQWNDEYANGKWDYLGENTSEKSRSAVIAMYCQHFASSGRILDVGCGKGTLFEFLNDRQKNNYFGIDVSEVAVAEARQRVGLKAVVEDADKFHTEEKFDIIIFNEVLYYLDYRAALIKYSSLLNENGIVIISMFRNKNFFIRIRLRKIWRVCRLFFEMYEELKLTGKKIDQSLTWDMRIMRKSG
jgi:2-polyprenyl-3-methyl-5-hydroxy-6-metoxy-1,4-benzoquinol methylase